MIIDLTGQGSLHAKKIGCQSIQVDVYDADGWPRGSLLMTLDQAIEISSFVKKNAVKTNISKSGKELK